MRGLFVCKKSLGISGVQYALLFWICNFLYDRHTFLIILPHVGVKMNLLDPAPKMPHADATSCTSDDYGLEGAQVDGHRDSALTIYCFNGAFRCGKTLNLFNPL